MKTENIYTTRDYNKFKRLIGNREVSRQRIAIIKKSIETVGYISNPIIVNEKFEIIDGQGRFAVLKELGMPIEYRIIPGLTIEHCQAMNLKATGWTLEDYVKSYAETGNENYIRLIELHKETGLSYCVIANAKEGSICSGAKTILIREGKLEIPEDKLDSIKDVLNYVARFKDIQKSISGRAEMFFTAIGFCYFCKEVDKERLFEVIHTRPYMIHPVANAETLLKEIEDAYNFRLSKNKRIYLVYLLKTRNRREVEE